MACRRGRGDELARRREASNRPFGVLQATHHQCRLVEGRAVTGSNTSINFCVAGPRSSYEWRLMTITPTVWGDDGYSTTGKVAAVHVR